MTGQEKISDLALRSERVAAFFDFDGTVACVDSFVLLGLVAGWKGIGCLSLAGFLKALMDYQRNRLTNTQLKEVFLSDLKGVSQDRMRELCGRLFDRLVRPTLRPALKARIDRHNRSGHVTVLLSASFEEQLLPAADYLRVRAAIGSKAQVVDGALTGRLEGEACHGVEKARAAKAFCESRGIDLRGSFAYGDTLSDLPVLELCGHACVVNGSARLRRIAERRGWEILNSPSSFWSLVGGFTGLSL